MANIALNGSQYVIMLVHAEGLNRQLARLRVDFTIPANRSLTLAAQIEC